MIKTLTASDLTDLFFKKVTLRFKISEEIITNKRNLFINAF